MSHFSVLVITKETPTHERIDEMLAPFDENIPVPEYISKTRQQLIDDVIKNAQEAKKRYEKHLTATEDDGFNEKGYLEKYPRILEMIDNKDEIGLYLEAIKYYEESEIDENGNAISTYNPDSKWDWYSIGGRFSDVLDDNPIQVKDFPVPVEGTEEELIKKFPDEYKYYQDLIAGKVETFHRLSYIKERYPDFKTYINTIRNTVTYAVLDADGVWHEPGRMGMFAMTSASTDDEINWDADYYKNFIKDLPEDWWLTVVDCHI